METDSLYSLVPTDDGTYSLYSKDTDECMHTSAGAYEESIIKHVNQSQLIEKIRKGRSVRVLDVGFGLGYNILALLESVSSAKVDIVSLEYDKSIGQWLEKVTFNDSRDEKYSLIRKAFADGSYVIDDIKMEIRFGDARDQVKSLISEKQYFDAVFHDPFSPSKNPELWSVDFFKSIYDLMNEDAVLTTYSAAMHIRRALIENGFYISHSVSTGNKKEGTIAAKTKDVLENAFSGSEIEDLLMEVKSVPYRDTDGTAERKQILEKRIDEMQKIRADRRARQE